ncbi:Fic family protein [Capnocytophaga sputigena]|uniref:Fic family protein n=1 Tax=Capnocytophaga sputigena TaxID=1019 RepID=A0AAX2IBT6_CAPSP|nr:Fic family protein [Capnocytophaga sputigena]ATA84625.1 Fic family protein [Capnocytophaga sputigena]EEB66657.1 Fic family protein [Capnocytophaga sputigena ATCC 33612]SQA75594.1 Protein involved in cell division [Capnocytophaga sputigena]
MTTDILNYIDQLSATYNSLLPMSPENQRRWDKKVRLEFNYNSNHIEGNTLTYGETELLLLFDETHGSRPMRDYEEMKAHDVAFQKIKEWATDTETPLTEQEIKNLNQIILVQPFWKNAITPDGQPTRRQITVGNYKTQPNSVRLPNGELFEYTAPQEVPIKMQELMEWYRDEQTTLHPVTLAAMFHYKFVCIHPFDDGNGRVSRLLMNYVLLAHKLPPVVIKSSDKQNYLHALHLADTGQYEAFIRYIAEQVVSSLEMAIKAAKGESIEEPDDLDKEIALVARQLQHQETYKTPQQVLNVFHWAQQKLLAPCEAVLQKFDKLFQEKKRVRKVNHKDVEEENRNSLLEVLTASVPKIAKQLNNPIKKENVYGIDPYTTDIYNITLQYYLYGSAYARDSSVVNCIFYISFEKNSYTIEIEVMNDYLFKKSYPYSTFPDDESISVLPQQLGKELLAKVKKV